MGMKYKDPTTGKFKEINVKVADTLPVGSEVDYNGTTIPTGWEEVDSPNEYSTEETKIGTWIDGKPLYRKTIRGTVNKINETYTIDTISDLKEVIDVRGTALAAGKYFTPFNTMLNTELQNILQVDAKTGAVLTLFGKAFLSNKYTAIVEYTKNTD